MLNRDDSAASSVIGYLIAAGLFSVGLVMVYASTVGLGAGDGSVSGLDDAADALLHTFLVDGGAADGTQPWDPTDPDHNDNVVRPGLLDGSGAVSTPKLNVLGNAGIAAAANGLPDYNEVATALGYPASDLGFQLTARDAAGNVQLRYGLEPPSGPVGSATAQAFTDGGAQWTFTVRVYATA